MSKKHTSYIITAAVVIGLIVAAYFAYCHWSSVLQILPPWGDKRGASSVTTETELMRIIPQQQLYVSTAVIEDYTTEHATEYHLGFFPEDHQCAMVMRQKVSYVLNTADIRFQVYDDGTNDSKRVMVIMPELIYTASTQSVDFMSDDETFWAQQRPSTTDMKQRVEQQIRHRIDTPEARRKANLYAQEAISALLKQMGYEADFQPVAHPNIGG